MIYYIKSLKDIETYNLRVYDLVEFQCEICTKLQTNNVRRLKQKGALLCGDCQKAKTNVEKFGCANTFDIPGVREKGRKVISENKEKVQAKKAKTLQKHYNLGEEITNPMQIDEYKNNCILANKNNHDGVMWQQTEEGRSQQSKRMKDHPEIQIKSVETNKRNHGGIHSLALPETKKACLKVVTDPVKKIEIQKTREETNKKLYNNPQPYIFGSPEYVINMLKKLYDEFPDIRDKVLSDSSMCKLINFIDYFNSMNMINLNLIFGDDFDELKCKVNKNTTFGELARLIYERQPELINKAKQIIFEKYGTLNLNHRYNYFNIYLDSSWELAVWIYCKDHGINIIRNPISFKYIDSNGTEKYYEVDFWIDGIGYVEVKGDQFFDENGKMIYPYSKKHHDSGLLTRKEKDYYNSLYELKHQCGLQNGVHFWTSKDIQPYLDYCNIYYQGWDILYRKDNPYNPTYWCLNYNNPIMYYIPKYRYEDKGINPYNKVIDNDGYVENTGKGVTPFDISKQI